jgi:hypothetical protein
LLKSAFVVSEDLKTLAGLIKQYSEKHINPIFGGDDYEIAEEYRKEHLRMIEALKGSNQGTLRKTVGAYLSSEPDLLTEIERLLQTTEGEQTSVVDIQGITNSIRKLKELRGILLTMTAIDPVFVNNYYDITANLLLSLSAVRAGIETLWALADKLGTKEPFCTIVFSNTSGEPFAIKQQKEMIIFVEKIFTCFFEKHMDILFVDIDTGSPQFECSIRANLEAKVTWDITQLFSDFFKHLFGCNNAGSIRAIKRINDQLNESQKRDTESLKAIKEELSQEEYEKRLLAIFDEYSALRRNQIEVAINNTDLTKRLETRLPLLLGETGGPNAPQPDTP